MIVDSHCHTSDHWYEPVEVLIQQMHRTEIDAAVLMQHSGQYDNTYLLDCVREFPGVLAAAVVLDTSQLDAGDQLATLQSQGAAGLRLNPTTRSPGADPLAIWRRAGELGVPVSVLGSQADFDSAEFRSLLSEVPEIQVVVEHLGTRGKTGSAYTPEEAAGVFSLAAFGNVHMKFHGLAEFTPRHPDRTSKDPFARPLRPHLQMAYEAFGPDRLLWGSDYPPVSAREGLANSLHYPQDELRRLGASDPDLEQMFGSNAARLFGLPTRLPALERT